MELRILRYFLAVAEEGCFSRAAERLHVSQPALSQQIAAFENEIGARLFERSSRHLALTDKGSLLLGHARDLVELARRTEESLKANDADELSGTLVIGAGEVTAFGYLAEALTTLHRQHNIRDSTSASSPETAKTWPEASQAARSTLRSSLVRGAMRTTTMSSCRIRTIGGFFCVPTIRSRARKASVRRIS